MKKRIIVIVSAIVVLITVFFVVNSTFSTEADFSDETFKKWVDNTPWVGKMSFVAN